MEITLDISYSEVSMLLCMFSASVISKSTMSLPRVPTTRLNLPSSSSCTA